MTLMQAFLGHVESHAGTLAWQGKDYANRVAVVANGAVSFLMGARYRVAVFKRMIFIFYLCECRGQNERKTAIP